ncbi:hypothetical protein D3C80_1655570 [compost metagenome]
MAHFAFASLDLQAPQPRVHQLASTRRLQRLGQLVTPLKAVITDHPRGHFVHLSLLAHLLKKRRVALRKLM